MNVASISMFFTRSSFFWSCYENLTLIGFLPSSGRSKLNVHEIIEDQIKKKKDNRILDEDQSSNMASSNRKNIKRLLSWSSGSSSTASENEDESKLGWVKRN